MNFHPIKPIPGGFSLFSRDFSIRTPPKPKKGLLYIFYDENSFNDIKTITDKAKEIVSSYSGITLKPAIYVSSASELLEKITSNCSYAIIVY